MASDTVRLVLSGRSFEGWTALRITRSMQAGAGTFDLSVTEHFPSEPAVRVLKPGEPCEVWIGDDRLITGYVDEVSPTLGARQHTVAVRGRDRVADLIDCSDPNVPADFNNVSLTRLAETLAKPFGIPVTAAADVGENFIKVSINPGARGFEVLEQHCQYRQLLPLSDGAGGLVLTRAGQKRASGSVIEGVNLLAGSATYSFAERYSVYTVRGQSFDLGDGARGPSQEYSDAKVKRYRPLYIVASEAVDEQRCLERARWESLTRAARGEEAHLTVQGWRDQAGALWEPNRILAAVSPTLGLSGDYLLTEAVHVLDGNGSTTQLSIVRPDAFTVAPNQVPQDDFLAEIPETAEG